MKTIIVLLVGLLAGAVLATTAIGALAARDRYPTSVMVVMQANLSALQRGLRAQDCGLPDADRHVRQLGALATEIPRAFAMLERESADFIRSREVLEDTVRTTLARPPADCEALNRSVTAIAQSCDACHNGHR